MPSLECIECLVCDDVRMEVSNKETIVGVYLGGVTIPEVPIFVNLVFWLSVIWSGDGNIFLRSRITDPAHKELIATEGFATAALQGHPTSLVVRGLYFEARMEGVYQIQWQRGESDDWTTIRTLPIYLLRA